MLDTSQWKRVLLKDICTISMGNKLDFSKMSTDSPTVLFVGRTGSNNGVMGRVDLLDDLEPYPGGDMTIALGGTLGHTCVQTEPFYTSQNVAVLHLSDKISTQAKLFLSTIIMEECKYRFVAFGRELNTHIRRDFSIKLPTTNSGKPDWQWMDTYMQTIADQEREGKSPLDESLMTQNLSANSELPNISKWKWFKLGGEKGLFEIKKGKRLTSEDQTKGDTPYIGAIDSNNGIANRIGQRPMHEGNTISLSYNGSIGEAFYQLRPFWATDDVNVLYLRKKTEHFNKYSALFLCTILKQEKYRYSYGRKWTVDNMENTLVKLPALPSGIPNWEYMATYIESLPYGDRI